MSNALTFLTSEITDYLLLASLLAVILTSLAVAIIKVARIRAAIYRHMIWLYTLIGVVVFPVVWLCGPMLTFAILPAESQTIHAMSPEVDSCYDVGLAEDPLTDIPSPELLSAESAVTSHAILPRPFPVKAMLAGIWLYGVILMLIRLSIGWVQLRRICRFAEPASGNSRIKSSYGGIVQCLLTAQVDGPVCFGVLKPVILLPREMYHNGRSEDLQMALGHELAHIERKDCWTNLFQRIVEAIFFFHPFVWYASFQLTQQREQICDNYVIRNGVRVLDYSRFLSRIAEQSFERTWFQAVALFEGRLLQRVRSLLDPMRSTHIKASRWATVAGLAAAMVCLTFGTVRLTAKPGGNSNSADSSLKKNVVMPQGEMIIGKSRPKGNCSISGKVISAKSGEPVRHATVILSTDNFDSIVVNATSDGTFIFEDIPTGPFSLGVINTIGFRDVFYNPQNKPGSRPQFSLKDAEKRADVVLRAVPGCSITGRILDENGEPLKGQRLYVRAYEELTEPKGEKRYDQATSSRMARDSSYTLNGLSGRPVYVMVIDSSSEFKDEYYPPCYYPGTLDRNKAIKVTFDEKMSAENFDIRLQKKGDLILKGVVTDEKTGDPIPKTLITVHHRDMLFDQVTAYTDERGRYHIDTIGTGEFLVHVDARPWGLVRMRKPVKIDAAKKTTVLDFKLRRGATIFGKLVDEKGIPVEIDIDRFAYGLAYQYDPTPSGTTGSSWSGARNRYSTKGYTNAWFESGEGDYESERMIFPTPSTFIIEGVIPGTTILSFNPRTENQTVKEILYNGDNVTQAGIETKPGQEIKDVTIVIKR